jgi:hypothetical protein
MEHLAAQGDLAKAVGGNASHARCVRSKPRSHDKSRPNIHTHPSWAACVHTAYS